MNELELYLQRRDAVLQGVRAIILDRLELAREPDELDPDAPLFVTGLQLDSVDAVELVVALEERFGVSLPDGAETLAAMRTVGTIVDRVLELQS